MNTQELCSHCAGIITHTRLEKSGEIYCCHACAMVADLLRTEKLDDQYRHLLELSHSQPRKVFGDDLEVLFLSLENPDNWRNLGRWHGEVHQIDLYSPQIHCAACSWLLEKAVGQIEGIAELRVDFPRGQLTLSYYPEKISLVQIMRRSLNYGYKLSPLENRDPQEDRMEKSLLLRISVAGFVLMNVMTFTISAYLEHFSSLREWTPVMNTWALILTLPVILYSATPFYSKAWAGLRVGVLHMDLPVSLGILFSFVASVILWSQGKVAYFDTAAGVVFFLLVGRWWVQRFEKGLIGSGEWMGQLLPERIRVWRFDQWKSFLPKDLVIGDRICLGSGELVPAASILIGVQEREFDPQWMTGESRLERIIPGQKVPSGYICTAESEMELLEDLRHSDFSKLRQEWQSQLKRTHGPGRAEKLVPYFTLIILCVSFLVASRAVDRGWGAAFEQAALVLILSCPCALALARPVSEGLALQKARKNGFLLRDPATLDALDQIDWVVLDKTGTLTSHRREIIAWEWQDPECAESMRPLVALVASRSLHPASRALAEELSGEDYSHWTIVDQGQEEHLGIWARIQKGEEYHLIWLCRAWLDSFEKARLFLGESNLELSTWDSMVLLDGKVIALMRYSESLLPGAREMIQSILAQGKQVLILSGDRPERVESLANELGVSQYFGALTPFEKKEQIQKLQEQGAKVLTVGDGFNDALMLGQGNLSALAWGGVKALGSGADLLALRGNWTGFTALFRSCRLRLWAERAGYLTSVVYNIMALWLAFSGDLPPLVGAIAMPLSSLSVGLIAWFFFAPWSKLKVKMG